MYSIVIKAKHIPTILDYYNIIIFQLYWLFWINSLYIEQLDDPFLAAR
jgi:hypothetical protein